MAVDEQINFEITGSVDLALAKTMWAQKVSDELEEERDSDGALGWNVRIEKGAIVWWRTSHDKNRLPVEDLGCRAEDLSGAGIPRFARNDTYEKRRRRKQGKRNKNDQKNKLQERQLQEQ